MDKRLLFLLFSAWMVVGCSALASPDVGAGVGARCTSASDCQAGFCQAGICTIACRSSGACPAPAVCAHDTCQLPLRVGAVLTGSVNDQEGWTSGHWTGLRSAADALGYVTLDSRSNVDPGHPDAEIAQLIAAGAQVIIGDTVDYGASFLKAARQNPTVNFLWDDDEVKHYASGNATSYWIRRMHAWYIAGKVAATRAKQRLGVISAFINPETTRNINAFTLGARSIKPDMVVEVRYIGFWFDPDTKPDTEYNDGMTTTKLYREEVLALQMMDSGCEVIAHLSNTQRSVRKIDERARQGATTSVSFANDSRDGWRNSAGMIYGSSLGSIYENWEPLYYLVFDQIHRKVFDGNAPIILDINKDPVNSPTGVSLNPNLPVDETAMRAWIHSLATPGLLAPNQRIFMGPFATTGQRDGNADGAVDAVQFVTDGTVVSDEELRRMCWYVKGVVERSDPNNPRSLDRDARVPGGLDDRGAPALAKVPFGLSLRCLDNTNPF